MSDDHEPPFGDVVAALGCLLLAAAGLIFGLGIAFAVALLS